MIRRRRFRPAFPPVEPGVSLRENVADRLAMLVLVQQADKVVHAWEEVGMSEPLTAELERLREALRVLGERS